MCTVDIRTARETASVLLFICVIGQPLVYAHANGFSISAVLSHTRVARSLCMEAVQRMVEACFNLACYAFMVGEFRRGAPRLITAPVATQPPPHTVIRTPAERRRRLAAGGAFVWCTLGALRGTAVEDAAARAVLATEAFARPTADMAGTTVGAHILIAHSCFAFGAQSAYLAPAPEMGGVGPSAETAGRDVMAVDRLLIESLGEAADDPLLTGWRDMITPLVSGDLPQPASWKGSPP